MPGAGNREHPVRELEAENTRSGSWRPRTPGIGNREHPVMELEAENARHTRKPRLLGQGSREHPWS